MLMAPERTLLILSLSLCYSGSKNREILAQMTLFPACVSFPPRLPGLSEHLSFSDINLSYQEDIGPILEHVEKGKQI